MPIVPNGHHHAASAPIFHPIIIFQRAPPSQPNAGLVSPLQTSPLLVHSDAANTKTSLQMLSPSIKHWVFDGANRAKSPLHYATLAHARFDMAPPSPELACSPSLVKRLLIPPIPSSFSFSFLSSHSGYPFLYLTTGHFSDRQLFTTTYYYYNLYTPIPPFRQQVPGSRTTILLFIPTYLYLVVYHLPKD